MDKEWAAEIKKQEHESLARSILRDTLRLHPAWSEQRRVRFAIDLATRFYVEIERDSKED